MAKRKIHCLAVILLLSLGVSSVYGQIDTVQVNSLFDMSFEDLLDQQVISVSKYKQFSSDAPSSVTIVNSEEIRNFGYTTLDEILNAQKGFYISNDRNYSYAGNRGFGRPSDYNNRSLLLLNGHTLNENVYGSATLGSALALNIDLIDRIEIVRGPGSSMYGSGAMLNVINIITKKGSDIDGIDIKASVGSYNKKEISALWGKNYKNGFDVSVSGIAGNSDGPDLYFEDLDTPERNNGRSTGLDWEKRYGLNTSISKNNLTLRASLSNRTKGIPTGAWETDLINNSQSSDNRYFVELLYKKDLSEKLALNFRAFYDGYKYDGTYSYDSYKSYDSSVGKWGGSELQFIYSISDKNTLTGGVEYKYNSHASYKEWDSDNVYSDNNSRFSEFSFYVQDEYEILPKLHLTAGFRFDSHSLGASALSPRLAAVYNSSKASTFKIIHGVAHRNPNFYETQYKAVDTHKSSSTVKDENIHITELVWEYKSGNKFKTSVSAYHYMMTNLIDLALDPNDGLTYFENKGKVLGTGIEFEMNYKAGKNSNFYLNNTIQKAVDNDSGAELSNSPRFLLKARWSQLVADMFTIAPECFYETKRITVYQTTTDPFFLANLNFTSKIFLQHFSVNFKIKNIFNREYYLPGGFEVEQNSIIQNGRNFAIGINASF